MKAGALILIVLPVPSQHSLDLHDFLYAGTALLSEISGQRIIWRRIGSSNDHDEQYEGMRDSALAKRDKADAAAYKAAIEDLDGQKSLWIREYEKRARRFGLSHRDRPALVFYPKPEVSKPLIMKIDVRVFDMPEQQRKLVEIFRNDLGEETISQFLDGDRFTPAGLEKLERHLARVERTILQIVDQNIVSSHLTLHLPTVENSTRTKFAQLKGSFAGEQVDVMVGVMQSFWLWLFAVRSKHVGNRVTPMLEIEERVAVEEFQKWADAGCMALKSTKESMKRRVSKSYSEFKVSPPKPFREYNPFEVGVTRSASSDVVTYRARLKPGSLKADPEIFPSTN